MCLYKRKVVNCKVQWCTAQSVAMAQVNAKQENNEQEKISMNR